MADRSLRRRARALLPLGPPPAVPDLSPELLDLRAALAALPLAPRQVIVLHPRKRGQPGTGAGSVRVRP